MVDNLHFPQVRALWPGVLHFRQTRARFAGGWCSAAVPTVDEVVPDVVVRRGVEVPGSGVVVGGRGVVVGRGVEVPGSGVVVAGRGVEVPGSGVVVGGRGLIG